MIDAGIVSRGPIRRETCLPPASTQIDQQHPGAADRRGRHVLPARSSAGRCGRRLPPVHRRRRYGSRPVAARKLRAGSIGPRPALALPHRAGQARLRLVGRLRPADPRRDPGAPAQHAVADGQRGRAVVQPRLCARHRRRRAAGKCRRPRAVDRLAGALRGAEFLARPGAERDLLRATALVPDRRDRNHRVGQSRALPARSTSPAIWCCRWPRSASSIWRCSCA